MFEQRYKKFMKSWGPRLFIRTTQSIDSPTWIGYLICWPSVVLQRHWCRLWILVRWTDRDNNCWSMHWYLSCLFLPIRPSRLEQEIETCRRNLSRKSKAVRFNDYLDAAATGPVANMRKNFRKEDQKSRMKKEVGRSLLGDFIVAWNGYIDRIKKIKYVEYLIIKYFIINSILTETNL